MTKTRKASRRSHRPQPFRTDLEKLGLRAEVGHLGGMAGAEGGNRLLEALDLLMRALERVLGRQPLLLAALHQEGVGLLQQAAHRPKASKPPLCAAAKHGSRQQQTSRRFASTKIQMAPTSRLRLSSFLSLPLALSLERFLSRAACTLAHSPLASLPLHGQEAPGGAGGRRQAGCVRGMRAAIAMLHPPSCKAMLHADQTPGKLRRQPMMMASLKQASRGVG